MPHAVAVARTAEDVAAIVRWAREQSLPVTPRGSGSSMASGAIGPGIVLDVSRLDEIGAVDVAAKVVRCGAGALRNDIDSAARKHGLRLPVDPSSGAFCTIGGMVATNAAGSHSLRAGSIRNWIRAAECVLADGTAVTLRRGETAPHHAILSAASDAIAKRGAAVAKAMPNVRKNSSGYAIAAAAESGDLLDVIIGSEGTLAIVTSVEVALDAVPRATSTVLAAFDDLGAAARGAILAAERGAAACELLERTFLDFAARSGRSRHIPAGTQAALLIEFEAGDAGSAQRSARELAAALDAAGASATTLALESSGETELWELRHAASPILSTLEVELRSVQVIEDGAVPRERLAEYIEGVRAALDGAGVRGVIFGHAGDAHVHVNPLVDFSSGIWREQLAHLLDETTSLTAKLGGTLSGEHGDGRLRAPLLAKTWSADALAAFTELKNAFDPDGTLNPGVKIALPGQQPLEDVKYDPTLPRLPDSARAALDHVSANRAYAEPRLPLLEQVT